MFDLQLQTLGRDARDRLWTSALTAHRRWQESKTAKS
jgi:hypothetical protein